MDISKIELLVKKIDQAVKIIQKLQEDNSQLLEKAKKLEIQNNNFQKENIFLKEENQKFKKDINDTNNLHEQLENKIQEILKYLPDEDDSHEKKEKNKIDETPNDDKDEERLKEFVNSPDNSENKGLFNAADTNEEGSQKEQTEKEEKIHLEENKGEKVNTEREIRFEETLIEQNENDNVDFYFNNEETTEDLPKGVL